MAERPVQMYEQTNGRPLVADILDLGTVYGHLGLDGEIGSINQYILDEIDRRDLQPTESSYRQIYEDMRSKLDIDYNTNFTTVIPKLATWAEVMQRNHAQDQLRKQLLDDDPQ